MALLEHLVESTLFDLDRSAWLVTRKPRKALMKAAALTAAAGSLPIPPCPAIAVVYRATSPSASPELLQHHLLVEVLLASRTHPWRALRRAVYVIEVFETTLRSVFGNTRDSCDCRSMHSGPAASVMKVL